MRTFQSILLISISLILSFKSAHSVNIELLKSSSLGKVESEAKLAGTTIISSKDLKGPEILGDDHYFKARRPVTGDGPSYAFSHSDDNYFKARRPVTGDGPSYAFPYSDDNYFKARRPVTGDGPSYVFPHSEPPSQQAPYGIGYNDQFNYLASHGSSNVNYPKVDNPSIYPPLNNPQYSTPANHAPIYPPVENLNDPLKNNQPVYPPVNNPPHANDAPGENHAASNNQNHKVEQNAYQGSEINPYVQHPYNYHGTGFDPYKGEKVKKDPIKKTLKLIKKRFKKLFKELEKLFNLKKLFKRLSKNYKFKDSKIRRPTPHYYGHDI